MNTRLIITTSERGCREDCSVYYANYYLVCSDTLTFSEPIFDDDTDDGKWVTTNEKLKKSVIRDLTTLGYEIFDLTNKVQVLCLSDYEGNVDNEQEDADAE